MVNGKTKTKIFKQYTILKTHMDFIFGKNKTYTEDHNWTNTKSRMIWFCGPKEEEYPQYSNYSAFCQYLDHLTGPS